MYKVYKHRLQIKPNFVIDNKRIADRRVIANKFNKYFVLLAPSFNEVYINENLTREGRRRSNENGLRINTITDITEFLHDKCYNNIVLRECNKKKWNP